MAPLLNSQRTVNLYAIWPSEACCVSQIYIGARRNLARGSKVYLLDHFLSIPSAVFRFCASQNVVGLIEANIARRIIYAGQVPPLAHAAHACGRR